MILIIQQRSKCIGCNACVESDKFRWKISRKDGKCTLVGSINKNGYYQVKINRDELDANILAAEKCPVKIIQIKYLK